MTDDDVAITAKFKETEYDITVNCEPYEAATAGCQAKAEPSKAAKGATVTLTATAAEDYEFVK